MPRTARDGECNQRAPPRTTSYPQTTMRVRKRNGSAEPVDVNKIVRAVSRCCVGPDGRRRDARRDEDDQRALRRRDDARARPAVDPDGGRAHLRGAAVRAGSRRAFWRRTSTRRCAGRRSTRSRSRCSTAQRLGLANERLTAFVTGNARKLNDAIVVERDREFEYFGLRTVYDRYLLRHPKTRLVIETPQQFFLRIACALSETVPEALELYRLFSDARVPAQLTDHVQRRHPARAALELLPARLARGSPGGHLPEVHRRRDALEVLGRHRARLPPGAVARVADREHERALERHRAVAEDAGRVGRGGEPGRQAQGRLLRLPRAVARRHRGVPRDARQHRRRGQPHAQPQPRQLDPRPVHAARGGGRGLEPLRSQAGAGVPRPLRRGLRARLRGSRAGRARRQDGQGARALRDA